MINLLCKNKNTLWLRAVIVSLAFVVFTSWALCPRAEATAVAAAVTTVTAPAAEVLSGVLAAAGLTYELYGKSQEFVNSGGVEELPKPSDSWQEKLDKIAKNVFGVDTALDTAVSVPVVDNQAFVSSDDAQAILLSAYSQGMLPQYQCPDSITDTPFLSLYPDATSATLNQCSVYFPAIDFPLRSKYLSTIYDSVLSKGYDLSAPSVIFLKLYPNSVSNNGCFASGIYSNLDSVYQNVIQVRRRLYFYWYTDGRFVCNNASVTYDKYLLDFPFSHSTSSTVDEYRFMNIYPFANSSYANPEKDLYSTEQPQEIQDLITTMNEYLNAVKPVETPDYPWLQPVPDVNPDDETEGKVVTGPWPIELPGTDTYVDDDSGAGTDTGDEDEPDEDPDKWVQPDGLPFKVPAYPGVSFPDPTTDPDPGTNPDPDPGVDPEPDLGTDDNSAFDTSAYTYQLTDVFPFCLVFDAVHALQKLNAEPVAPKFTWNFNFLGHDYSVGIDLSDWNDVAALLRKLELLAFAVGLAIKTRDIIKG